MSSVKKLKKSIDNKVFEVISDCLLFNSLHPEDRPEEIADIIESAVALKNELIERSNHPESKDDRHEMRKHYKTITSDLDKGIDELFERLSAISMKKKKR